MNFNKLIFNTQGGVINKQAVQIVSANGVMGCYEVIGGCMFRREAETRCFASLCQFWVVIYGCMQLGRDASRSRLYDPSSLFLSLQIFSQGRAK